MKKLFFLLSIIMLITSSPTFSQTSIFKTVTAVKQQGAIFKKTANVFSILGSNTKFERAFKNNSEVGSILLNSDIAKVMPSFVTLSIPVSGRTIELELMEKSINSQIMINDVKEPVKNPLKARHYRGIIKNDPNSIVAISFFDNHATGIIGDENGNYNLAYDFDTKQQIIFNDKNLIAPVSFSCNALPRVDIPPYSSAVLAGNTTTHYSKCVKLYYETEYDVYNALGGLNNTISYIFSLYNQVAALYENEGIDTDLSEIRVWSIEDPYTASSFSGTLTQFQAYRTSINGTLGQLINFRLNGGGSADIGTLCNPTTASRLSVAGFPSWANTIPPALVYSFPVLISTHEFGHLLGSRHTNACVWNGNNTAIDGCWDCMEDPNLYNNSCSSCPLAPIPDKGTIMSYCYALPSENPPGVDFALGFGPQPGNVIRNAVANASCLGCCGIPNITMSGPAVLCSSGVYSLNDLPSGSTVTWSSSNNSIATINSSGIATRHAPGRVIFSAIIILPDGCGQRTVTSESFDAYPVSTKISHGSALSNGWLQAVQFFYDGAYLWDEMLGNYFEFESLDGKTISASPPNDLISNPPYNAKGAELIVYVNSGGSPDNIYMRARAHKECVDSDWKYLTIPLNPVNGYYNIAYDNHILRVTADEVKTGSAETISAVKVSDLNGKIILQFFDVKDKTSFESRNLIHGYYIVEIITDKRSERQIFEVKK